jgi:hypothetical protein
VFTLPPSFIFVCLGGGGDEDVYGGVDGSVGGMGEWMCVVGCIIEYLFLLFFPMHIDHQWSSFDKSILWFIFLLHCSIRHRPIGVFISLGSIFLIIVIIYFIAYMISIYKYQPIQFFEKIDIIFHIFLNTYL